MNIKKLTAIALSIAAAIIISLNLLSFAASCDNIRSEVLRLHIIANSDSPEDQSVKIAVRDALLQEGIKLFSGTIDAEQAEVLLVQNKAEIQDCINKVLRRHSMSYSANLALVYEYFDEREYEGFVMPAGKYKAVKITLGEGKGKNWWCVMFPPLCLPAATKSDSLEAVFNSEEIKIITKAPRYRIKFKLIEWIEEIRNR